MIRSLGDEPPILADGRRSPDRREISFRWLSGTFLTGFTSSILMGVALFAALDGRQQLAIPAEAYAAADASAKATADTVKRGDRILSPNIVAKPSDRKIMEVATMIHDGEKEVVRRQPFSHVKMMLAANHTTSDEYPRFDPLAIFSTDDSEAEPQASRTGVIYGTDIESEVALRTVDFPLNGTTLPYTTSMTLDEVEENVRTNGSVLTDGEVQVASLYYIDPQRFASGNGGLDLIEGLSARIVEQNMTVSAYENISPQSEEYAEDVLPVRNEATIEEIMVASGYPKAQAHDVDSFIRRQLDSEEKLSPGDVLRICIIQRGEEARIVRASVYSGGRHAVTIAIDDKGRFVKGMAPPELAAVNSAFDDAGIPVVTSGHDLPRVYDGIYRAALSYGMGPDMTGRIIKLLASNVDFQARLKPSDSLEAFFSVTDEQGNATADSELLYVHARFGESDTRFYRFQNPEDGSIDYYDQDGKSIRLFLLRNPVPNGRFRSGFGMRRHPILGFSRMHTGVDWSAPRGTPIIAAGNGTVEKAGWDSGGYGRQTLIRHANGYVSSYNHQNAIAKGVVPGAKVVQGQVIGWVGTTGLSTGPHLHYELIVNGNKVDPLRIRLPGGKSLEGEALARFEEERERIDTLLGHDAAEQEVAASN